MFNTVNRCYHYTGIKFVLPNATVEQKESDSALFLPLLYTRHAYMPHADTKNTRAVSREHSPDTAAQTNTLKIQTTHIQTLSLLNELALLRKDSATTLYHTLIP